MKRETRIHDSKDESFFQSKDIDGAQIGFSRPPNAVEKPSVRFEDEKIYEITVDIHDESAKTVMATQKERNPPSLGSHVSSKLKQVSFNLKRLASSKSFSKDANRRAGSERALKGLQFVTQGVSKKGWPGVEAKFDALAEDNLLPRSKFGQCIGMIGSDEFASHLFDTLARRRGIMSSSVTKDQFHELWELLADKSFDARLQTFFDMVDKNADGRISEDEVKEIITLSASANKLLKIRDRADEYTALIMEELDPDNVGYIEINSLEVLLLEAPSQSSRYGANNRKMNQLLSLKLVHTKEPNPIKRWYKKTANYIEDHWQQIWVVALWVLINVGIFTWKFIQFKHKTVFKVLRYCVSSAKGGAEICKFNMALILLTVCRNTITWLRTKTKLGVVVPLDDNINFHMLVAGGIVIGIGLHAGAHAACNIPRILHATDQEYKYIARFFGENQPPNYWWFLMEFEGWTGATSIVLLIIVYIFALPTFRRNKLKQLPKPLKKITGYNSFWFTHHLLVIVYAFYIGHSYQLYLNHVWYQKTAWMYLTVPILLYTFERLTRVFRSNYKTAKILKVTVYPAPGDAIELHLSKPHGFKYRSGQYIFLKCISISRFEWHPFSITSAPADEHLSVHIRTLGDWTTELKTRFSKAIQPGNAAQSEILRADMTQGNDIPGLPEICLDGPYGAPSQDYQQYDILLLVGLGIGATPLVSVVKDVLYNIRQNKDVTETELGSSSTRKNPRNSYATSRAYFYWVTREEGSFEWFKGVLNEVAGIDQEEVIELHNHCTSVYEEGDARSALIAMIQTLHHAKTGVDVVSGTNVKTHFARPNWRNVFKQITINHPNKRVGVFYCGDPILVRTLRQLSRDFSRRTSTKFDFHKENF